MGIKRDFSKASIDRLKTIIKENVDDEKEWGFIDWVHDFFMDDLNVNDYLNDIDTYHSKMCDKHDISLSKLETILEKLFIIDTNYGKRLNSISDGLESLYDKISNVSEMLDPSAVTLSENSYNEIIDAVEKQCINELDNVKNDLEIDKQELDDTKEAYKDISWFDTACYKTYDAVTTTFDYIDWAAHAIGEGFKGSGIGMMGAGGAVMLTGGEVEIATAGAGTPVVIGGEVVGGVIVIGGGAVYLIGNVLYSTTDGRLGDGGDSYDRAKNSKQSQRTSAKEKAGSDSSSLGEVEAGKSSEIGDKALGKIKKKWGQKGVDAFEKAKNKGLVGPEGQNGIKPLKGKPYKGKYTYEIKVKNKEYGDFRIYGYKDSNGNFIFDLFDKGLH